MRKALLAILLTSPALADTPLTARAFAAHVGTDSVTYTYSSGARGTADYGPDGSLRWAFEGQPCFDGLWFARIDEICFAYPDGQLSACWRFVLDGERLRGTATELGSGTAEPLEIRETARSSKPLECPGPKVGA